MLNFIPDSLMLQWRMKTKKELACIQKIADKTEKNYRIQMIKHEVFFFITSAVQGWLTFSVYGLWLGLNFLRFLQKKILSVGDIQPIG